MILTVRKKRDHANIFSFPEIRENSTFRLFLKQFLGCRETCSVYDLNWNAFPMQTLVYQRKRQTSQNGRKQEYILRSPQ